MVTKKLLRFQQLNGKASGLEYFRIARAPGIEHRRSGVRGLRINVCGKHPQAVVLLWPLEWAFFPFFRPGAIPESPIDSRIPRPASPQRPANELLSVIILTAHSRLTKCGGVLS